jgi:hypothetical protein
VDERPCAHVHGPPAAAPLCKVSPVSVRVAEHVAPGLLAFVQYVIVAGCTRVCGREKLVDRIAVGRFGARQRERCAEEGPKTCGAIEVGPWLQDEERFVGEVFHHVCE